MLRTVSSLLAPSFRLFVGTLAVGTHGVGTLAVGVLAVGVLVSSGCEFVGGKAAPAEPDIDAGSIDGTNLVCAPEQAPTCEPGAVLRECNGDGTGFIETQCEISCEEAPEPHCGVFTPSNGVDVGSSQTDFTIPTATSLVFNTDTGLILDGVTVIREAGAGDDLGTATNTGIGFTQQPQVGGPGIGVFQFQSLTVFSGATLRGRGVAAMALVATGPIEVRGVIHAGGGFDACFVLPLPLCSGPGGGPGGSAELDGVSRIGVQGVGESGDNSGGNSAGEGGGGGGAFGSDGGDGGDPSDVDGGDGGSAFGPVELTPLVGGSGGAGGVNEDNDKSGGGDDCPGVNAPYLGGIGGGGGGAVQLVSNVAVRLTADDAVCAIDAGGGGGAGGGCSAAGGGGGAGGGILIEAPSITTDSMCSLTANGGGGGGAFDEGNVGSNGLQSLSGAPGSGAGQREGGTGGSLEGAATDSVDFNNETGGGGGGFGRIVLRSTAPGIVTDGIVSPAAERVLLTIE